MEPQTKDATMTFAAWDQVVRELEAASVTAQGAADWERHRDITKALELLFKLWNRTHPNEPE